MALRAKIIGDGPAGAAPSALNHAEVRRALAVLADPDHGCELRGLPSGRSLVRSGHDLDGLVAAAEILSDDRGVYYALNPVPADLDRGCKVADILYRRHLLIDVDAVKAPGQKDNSSTDAEHEAARQLALRVRTHLDGLGWPAPLFIDSTSGWHLVYRIDLSNDDHSRILLRTLLRRLAEKFDGPDGNIDRVCHNASRIARLPGTLGRKGQASPDRPHRMCRLVECPDPLVVVRADLIYEAVETLGALMIPVVAPTPAAEEPRPSGLKARAVNHDPAAAWARSAFERELGRVALCVENRNIQLNTSAFALGQIVAGGGLSRGEVEAALTEAAIRCGLDRDPNCGPAGIAATIRSGLDSGAKEPRQAPEAAPPRPSTRKVTQHPPEPIQGPLTIRASDIKPRKVEWLWPGRIPLGKLTTFAGVGGLGKTFVLLDVTVRVIRGEEWPEAAGECAEPGQVLFISGEDDPDDTLVPRLMELGATPEDLSRVLFLSMEALGQFQLGNDMLERIVVEAANTNPPLRLVAIDPPTGYLAGTDDHKNSELRGVLVPLKNLAARHRFAVILNTHLNKGGAGKVEAMMRVMGSVAWVNAVRAAHLFARDPDDPEKRLFIPMKSNLAKERRGLAYRIESTTDDMATLKWCGEIDTTADQAVSREDKKPKREDLARDWLIQKFRERLEWRSEDLLRAAKAEGISRNAIFEAKNLLSLPKARKVSLESGDVEWFWWVAPDWPHLSQQAPYTKTVGQLGHLDEIPL